MSEFAPAKRIYSSHPPQRTLMGPGPTEIHPRVRRPDNVMLGLAALGSYSPMGLAVHVGDAEAAAHEAYASMHAKAAKQKQQKTRRAEVQKQ